MFHDKGLFTATVNKDGSVVINRTKLKDKQYKSASKNLMGLDSNGFNAEGQARVREENKKVLKIATSVVFD